MSRVFLAGATGVIGRGLVPLLVAGGDVVAGLTRSPDKADGLRDAGAEPFVADVYDRAALVEAMTAFGPDVVLHELTDLPDELDRLRDFSAANARIRTEGTRNLLDAAAAAGAERFLAQSVAWELPGAGQRAVEEHERMVLDAGASSCATGCSTAPAPTTRGLRPTTAPASTSRPRPAARSSCSRRRAASTPWSTRPRDLCAAARSSPVHAP